MTAEQVTQLLPAVRNRLRELSAAIEREALPPLIYVRLSKDPLDCCRRAGITLGIPLVAGASIGLLSDSLLAGGAVTAGVYYAISGSIQRII